MGMGNSVPIGCTTGTETLSSPPPEERVILLLMARESLYTQTSPWKFRSRDYNLRTSSRGCRIWTFPTLAFPAKLRLVAMGSSHFFDSPKDALAWLDANEHSIRNSTPLRWTLVNRGEVCYSVTSYVTVVLVYRYSVLYCFWREAVFEVTKPAFRPWYSMCSYF